jgi:hypothetical protein
MHRLRAFLLLLVMPGVLAAIMVTPSYAAPPSSAYWILQGNTVWLNYDAHNTSLNGSNISD